MARQRDTRQSPRGGQLHRHRGATAGSQDRLSRGDRVSQGLCGPGSHGTIGRRDARVHVSPIPGANAGFRHLMIAILGASGQVGSALLRLLADAALPVSRADLDLEEIDRIGPWLRRVKPDAVINCAAYTAVDAAEVEVDLAYRRSEEHTSELQSRENIVCRPM